MASYPFREFIAGSDHKSGNPTIELKDFAAHVVEKFNVQKIEPWTGHFSSTDPKYLAEFRTAVEKAHAGVANIAVDGEHSPYAADHTEREKAIAYSKQWIDVAVAIGSPSVRTNILQVIDKVNSPWLHALPDFGNTLNAHDEDYAYRAIDAMFAHAYGICHVKDGEVNEQGKATHVDLARTFALLKRHKYKGYCSIEYDAPGDPYKPTADLIEQTVRYLYLGKPEKKIRAGQASNGVMHCAFW